MHHPPTLLPGWGPLVEPPRRLQRRRGPALVVADRRGDRLPGPGRRRRGPRRPRPRPVHARPGHPDPGRGRPDHPDHPPPPAPGPWPGPWPSTRSWCCWSALLATPGAVPRPSRPPADPTRAAQAGRPRRRPACPPGSPRSSGPAGALAGAGRWLAELWRPGRPAADPQSDRPTAEPAPLPAPARRPGGPPRDQVPPPPRRRPRSSSWPSPSACSPSPWSPARPATTPSTAWSASSGLYGYRINQALPAHAGRRVPGRRAGRHPGRDHAGRHPLRRGVGRAGRAPPCCCAGWARSASTSPTPTCSAAAATRSPSGAVWWPRSPRS